MMDTTYGPALPPHLTSKPKVVEESGVHVDTLDSSGSQDIIGPLPQNESSSNESQILLEERALKLKLEKYQSTSNQGVKDNEREQWMLELPQINSLGSLGLTNRKFRAKEGPDFSDRSCWTKTPRDKEKKIANSETNEEKISKLLIEKKDTEQHHLSKKHKKDRGDSLLEVHRRKLKAKKEKDTKNAERRPFNREIDLQSSVFDQSRTNSAIKKAQLLDTRFSSGKSKYL